MENGFDTKRLINFLRREMTLSGNSFKVSAGSVFGVLLVISLYTGYYRPQSTTTLPKIYLFTLFLCGLVFTSKIFAELNNRQKAYAYLTLPVSTAEKLVGSWLLSSPAFTILFFIISLILYLIACLTGSSMNVYTQIFDLYVWKSIATFLVAQSIFFLGAIYFRKNNFMKTLFALFLLLFFIMMIPGLYSGFMFRIVWGQKGESGITTVFDNDLMESLSKVISFAFWALLGPFMLLISYYKLKERRV
jgi:hypothetical protein